MSKSNKHDSYIRDASVSDFQPQLRYNKTNSDDLSCVCFPPSDPQIINDITFITFYCSIFHFVFLLILFHLVGPPGTVSCSPPFSRRNRLRRRQRQSGLKDWLLPRSTQPPTAFSPVAQKRKARMGMTLMSLTGESNVRVSTVKAIPAFCMAVSREMAMICKVGLLTLQTS